jgi:hypothetical protein
MSTLQDCLDVLGEVIQSQNQQGKNYEPTATDYFQVITHVLTTNGAAFQEKLALMLQVYQAVLPQTTSSLLAKQFPIILKTLMTIAKDNADNTTILSLAISCIGELLVAQRDLSDGFWSQLSVLQAVNAVIAFIDDENPKLRKASHAALLSLLSSHKQANCLSFRSYFTEFILNVFSSCTRNAYHRSHCLVVLLESCFLSLPEKSIFSVIEAMLKLQLCEISKLTSAIFRTLDAFYQNPSFLSLVSSSNVEKLVSTSLSLIMETTPKTNDIEALCHYLNVITNGYLLLMKVLSPTASSMASSLLSSNLERILSIFFTYSSTVEFTQIHCAIAMNLKRITNSWLQYGTFQTIIEQWYRDLFVGKKGTKHQPFQPQEFMSLMSSSASASSSSVPLAVKGIYWIISFYDRILVLKYSYCWIFLLESLRSFLDSSLFYSSPIPLPSGPSSASSSSNSTKDLAVYLLKGIVLKLSDIQTAVSQQVIILNSNSIINEIWQTLIKFLSIFTLIPFLSIIPLIEMSEDTTSSASLITRDWVFQLLGEELKHMKCKLADFVFCILPIASKLHKLITFFQSKSNSSTTSATTVAMDTDNKGLIPTTVSSYDKQILFLTNKLYALWKLLPDICYGEIIDLEIAFPKMIPIFQDTLSENEYDRLPGMIILTLKHIAEGFLYQKHYTVRGTEEKIRKVFTNQTAFILPMILKHLENVSFSNVEFQEIISCFHLWIQFTNEQLLNNISKKLLQLVLINTTIPSFPEGDDNEQEMNLPMIEMEQTEKAAKYMSVLLAIVPFMSSSLIVILYKTIYPLLSFTSPEVASAAAEEGEGAMEEEEEDRNNNNNEDIGEYHSHLLTKRAYNILYALINHHSKILFSKENNNLSSLQLLSLLHHSLLSTQVSVRNQRLRCLLILLTQHILPYEKKEVLFTCFQSMLGELLICLKDNSGKTRAQTMEIMKLFSRHLPKITVFQSFLSGILSETSMMRSATITAMSFHLLEQHKALYEYQQDRIEEGEDESEVGDYDENEEDKENDSEAEGVGSDDSENEDNEGDEGEEEEEVLDITSSSHHHPKSGAKKKKQPQERKSRSNTEDSSSMLVTTAVSNQEEEEETPLTNYTELVELGLQTLSSLYLLCSQEIVEQTKAILIYFKVIIILSTKEQLSTYAQSIVTTIHRSLGGTLKSKFIPKIRAIYRKLLRKLSENELRPIIPFSDVPLLDYILKENRKSLKKKLAKKKHSQRWKEAIEYYQRNGDRSLVDRLTAEEGEDEFDDEDLEVHEEKEVVSALPTFGNGKTVKGGKTTVKGSVVSRKTGKGIGTTTVAGRSIKSRFDLDQDLDDDDDNEEGGRETDYRFQSKSRVKGLTFNDFQSIHPSSLKELVQNKVSKKRLLGKEGLNGKNKRSFSQQQEDEKTANHDDYQDSDVDDDDDDNKEGDHAEEGKGGIDGGMKFQDNKRRAFGRGKGESNVNNPFPVSKQGNQSSAAASAASSTNKKQRLNNSSSLSLSHMNLNPTTSSGGSSHDHERYQVVITKEGKVKVTEKPTELFSANPSFDQLTSKTKTMKGGKSLTGMSVVGRNGPAGGGQLSSQRKEKVQKKGLRLKEPGIEYRAKKAGGDVWKKGQAVQPHAFIPLDARLLSKKHHNQAVEHFGVVVNNHNKKESRKKYKVVNKRGRK